MRLTLFTGPLLACVIGACGGDDGASQPASSTSASTATTSSTGAGAGGAGGAGGSDLDRPPAAEDWTRDIETTDLALDLAALTGTATITLKASASEAASFEVGDLQIAAVRDGAGPLAYEVSGSQLDVGVPAGDGPATVVIDYAFASHDQFDGWMPDSGVSFLWPTFCGNLFPCKSDPADGVRFTMSVTGVPAGKVAVYPDVIPGEAPSYMPAIAVGDFTETDLGTTSHGTAIKVWSLPGGEADALAGTLHLRDVFDHFETTYGPYSFGPTAGSVAADWGPGDFGGMEHHPFFHVGTGSMDSEEVQAHEAAHGWFGDGVRIACWEDFVLSEGTVTYMAGHALEQLGVDVWPSYECDLRYVCEGAENTIALPSTCGAIDILQDPLWSFAPYMKGAYYLRSVAGVIGEAALDQVLSAFYLAHVGGAARMDDLVLAIEAAAGPQSAEVEALATAWLRTLACPVDLTTLCN